MIDLFVILAPVLLLAVVALLGFVGCAAIVGLGDYYTAAPPISVTIDPPRIVSLNASETHDFTATVNNDRNSQGVTWSLLQVGNLNLGTIDPNTGHSVAPALIPGTQQLFVQVTATSVADPSQSDSATVTLNPISVTLNPPLSAILSASQTQDFTAAVSNDPRTSCKTEYKSMIWR